MYLEIFLADFAVFRVFWGISRDFAEIPEFRGSATARNIRSPDYGVALHVELLRGTKSAWDFLGVNFWYRDFVGFCWKP